MIAQRTGFERWRKALLHVTGCTLGKSLKKWIANPVLRKSASLARSIISQWRSTFGKIARRAFYLSSAQAARMHLVFQSFLVHNDINVFGELSLQSSE
jgi:hypothetical protein